MSYRRLEGDTKRQLKEQLDILHANGAIYDSGLKGVAKVLATTSRTLLLDKDGSQCKSLLKQLGRKESISFYSTPNPGLGGGWSHLTRLVVKQGNPEWTPFLETFPRTMPDDKFFFSEQAKALKPGQSFQVPILQLDWAKLPFDAWWREAILYNERGLTLSRGQLVLSMTDQDGGAHIDSILKDANYVGFSRENALGWSPAPEHGPEYACMRQIAYELEKTLHEQLDDIIN